jgi:hypothetical protein
MNVRVMRWLTVLCFGIGCSPAYGATTPSIPIGTLVAQHNDLAGFGAAVQTKPLETTFALEWALTSEQGIPAAEREAKILEHRGFEAGVQIVFVGQHEGAHERREADSVGMVFSSSAGAEEELAEESASGAKQFRAERSKRTVLLHGGVPGIPGSAQFGARDPRGAVDNVLFSVGRCYFVVADSLKQRSTARQVERPLRSAAITVYDRAKEACSNMG